MPLNVSAKTISISFRDNNNKKAADLVTALADEYIIYDVEERSRSSKKVISFIDNQLDKYYNKVKASENKIQYFQKTSKVSSVEEFSSIYSEQMDKLENQLVDIDLQRGILGEIKGAVLGELKQGNIVSSLLPILTGTEYEGGISSLINTLKELLLKRQNLLYEVTSDSEIAKSLDYQIDVQKNILIGSITTLTNKLEKRRKEIIKKANEIEAKYLSVPQKALDYARLQRVLSIDEKFLALLMNKRTEYSISEAGFVSQHTVLSAASIPTIPESPKKRLVLVAGLLVGIILSAILLIIRYLLKNTISSIEEITKLMNASIGILGAIPRYKHNIPVSQLVVDKSPKSIIAESFRSVRTSLKFISGDSDKKIMAITSTISGEGKTFFAINIGGIISLTGKKVVILDLDMRKPKIHLGFEVENERGMSTLLIGKDKIEQCIHHSSLENLDFITSGPVPPNPSELIINGEIDKVIKELKKTYDLIIIDNPPIGLVSDAMEMLQKADYPIYIFKSEYSKKSFIKNVDKLVLEDGISKLAVVLNSVEINRHSYGYGYGYGYGDGYYDIPELDKKSLMERVLGK